MKYTKRKPRMRKELRARRKRISDIVKITIRKVDELSDYPESRKVYFIDELTPFDESCFLHLLKRINLNLG